MAAENQWKNCMEYVALTDVGLRRSNNQDSHQEAPARNQRVWNSRGHVFVVADGMGGHAAGELASKLATDIVPVSYLKKTMTPPALAASEALQEANHQIFSKGNSDDNLRGMGTTCETLIILPEGAMFAHVGDSRAYRLRDGKLEQMTRDHSVVWELEEEGIPTENFAHRNVITRCLGRTDELKVDIEGPFPCHKGDIYLLCSDGLSGQFPNDAEMGMVLSVLPLPEATQALIDLANLRGGPDNITATTVKILGPQQAPNSVALARETQLDKKPLPAWIWVVTTIVCFLFAFFLLLFLKLAAWWAGGLAILSALGGAALAAYVLMQKAPSAFEGKRYGNSRHYRCYDAHCNENFVQTLMDTCAELRDSAEQQKPNAQWKIADDLQRKANAAFSHKHYEEAARNFLRAISFIWKTLQG